MFFTELITFLNDLTPLVKVLIIGMLTILICLSVVNVIKLNANIDKPKFKPLSIITCLLLIALFIFTCNHMF